MATTLPEKSQLTGNVTEGQFKSGLNQLVDYISENVGSGSTTGKNIFTTSGTFTVPAGVTQIYVSGCGGGGGGSSVYGCGGGGGASIYRRPITVTPGQSISYVVGSGGSGNTNAHPSGTSDYSKIGNVSGTAGTLTSFGSYFSLAGGSGATANVNGSSVDYYGGAAGGTGGTDGDTISMSVYIISSGVMSYNGGSGGSSMFGVGGCGGHYSVLSYSSSIGGNGAGFGAGGGGGALYQNGSVGSWTKAGSGSDGILIIEW